MLEQRFLTEKTIWSEKNSKDGMFEESVSAIFYDAASEKNCRYVTDAN